MSRARSPSGGCWLRLVERTAVACMKQQLPASKVAWGRKPWVLGGKQDHRRLFQDTPVDPRQVASTVAMSAFIEVAREWVQSGARWCTPGSHECSRTSAASTQCPHCPRVASAMPLCSCFSNRFRISTAPCARPRVERRSNIYIYIFIFYILVTGPTNLA